MNIEDKLRQMKVDYRKIEPSTYFLNNGWKNLENQLKSRKTHNFWPIWKWSFVTVSLVMLLIAGSIFGLFQGAKAALPGNIFYPLKRLSENVISKTTGNSQIKFENRAHEIIGLIKENPANSKIITKTIKEYQATVVKVETEIKKPEIKQEFEQKVANHRQEFQKLAEKDPEIKKDLQPVTEKHETEKLENHQEESESKTEIKNESTHGED